MIEIIAALIITIPVVIVVMKFSKNIIWERKHKSEDITERNSRVASNIISLIAFLIAVAVTFYAILYGIKISIIEVYGS